MTTRHILRSILGFFFGLFLNKLDEAIIKRKLQHNVGISKFMAPGPLDHYTSLYRINTSVEKNRLLIRECEKLVLRR